MAFFSLILLSILPLSHCLPWFLSLSKDDKLGNRAVYGLEEGGGALYPSTGSGRRLDKLGNRAVYGLGGEGRFR